MAGRTVLAPLADRDEVPRTAERATGASGASGVSGVRATRQALELGPADPEPHAGLQRQIADPMVSHQNRALRLEAPQVRLPSSPISTRAWVRATASSSRITVFARVRPMVRPAAR